MATIQYGKSAGRRIEDKKAAIEAGIVKRKGVPNYTMKDFDFVVYKVTYKGFLQNLSTSNAIVGYDRDFAETEWRLLVRSKWNEWAKFKPERERRAELNHALTQVEGFPGFNAVEYWTEYASKLKSKPLAAQTESGSGTGSGESKYAEDGFHEDTGLGLPLYEEKFDKIAQQLGYKEFLKRIDAINGPVLAREKADAAWRYFCQQKYYTWKSELPIEEKKQILEDALAQTTNGTASFYRNKMDLYWQKKQENLLKAQLGIPKDAKVEDDAGAKLKAQLGISEDVKMKDDDGSDEDAVAAKKEKSKKRKVETSDDDDDDVESEEAEVPVVKAPKTKKRKEGWRMLK